MISLQTCVIYTTKYLLLDPHTQLDYVADTHTQLDYVTGHVINRIQQLSASIWWYSETPNLGPENPKPNKILFRLILW